MNDPAGRVKKPPPGGGKFQAGSNEKNRVVKGYKMGISEAVKPLILRTFADLINLLLTTRFPVKI
jgi:hypothetical protein